MGIARFTKRLTERAPEPARAASGPSRPPAPASRQEKSARAASLSKQARKLHEAGEPGTAVELSQESLAIMRELAPLEPTETRFLALSLYYLSSSLYKTDRIQEALAANREVTTLLSDWVAKGDRSGRTLFAANLHAIARSTVATGVQEEIVETSLEAARFLRECIADGILGPAMLIEVLNFAANGLNGLSRIEEALLVRQEEVGLLRAQVAEGKTEPREMLARHLGLLSVLQVGVGKVDEAIGCAEECRTLISDPTLNVTPEKRAGIALSFYTLGFRLGELDHRQDAIPWQELSIELRRTLVAEEFDPDTTPLAKGLNNYAWNLGVLGRPEEALISAQEAVDLYRAGGSAVSTGQPWFMAAALDTLATQLETLGRVPEALPLSREAVALGRVAAERDPAAYSASLEACEQLLARLTSK